MSQFDPEQFLDSSISEPLTKRPPADAGIPFTATIGEPKARSWSGNDKKTGEPVSAEYLDFPLDVQLTPDVAARVGQERIGLKYSVRLDVTEAGGLDMAPGRNRGLRTLYEACDLNRPGTTPRMLHGRMITVTLKHRPAGDGTDAMYEDVQQIAKAA